MNAPTLVPISPVTIVAPSLLKAPTAVKSAKSEVVPRTGCWPETDRGSDNTMSAISRGSAFLFILMVLTCNGGSGTQNSQRSEARALHISNKEL